MQIIDLRCTSCGASLPDNNLNDAYVCEYCGTRLLVKNFSLDSPTRPESNVAIKLNSRYLTNLDIQPVIIEERTMIPVRTVANIIGATVGWDAATRTVTITKGNRAIKATIDNREAIIIDNGLTQTVELDVAPVINQGKTMFPVRFLAEIFGLGIDWDAAKRDVLLTTR